MLRAIRQSVIDYVKSKVTMTISALTPSGGSDINPNETFTFRITASNADAASGGIDLTDIVWYVKSRNSAVGQLRAPAATTATAKNALVGGSNLIVGNYYTEMYLFPPDGADTKRLLVGESDSINLEGKAGSAPAGGTTTIDFNIYADVDRDWLFPNDQPSAVVKADLIVKG
jgi:hypothetical protein